MTIQTAVIMAAGLGSRISEFSHHAPKGFLPVAGKPIIERSIEILVQNGIRHIVIGTGHKSFEYEALSQRTGNVKIDCIYNPDYENSGSLETFFLCTETLEDDFLSLESDLLYDARMIDRVLQSPHPNVMLGSEKTESGDEVYLQLNPASELVALSKDKSSLTNVGGELVGICKLSHTLPALIKTWMASERLERPAQIHYEEGLAKIAGSVPIYVEKTGLPWTEIDTPDHLDRAQTLIWPRIVSGS